MPETTPAPHSTAPHSTASVATPNASRYLQQLCKHFGHKVPASFDTRTGSITFPFGTCTLRADDAALHLSVTAPDAEQLERMRHVVGSHLLRFAFREELRVDWSA